MAQLSYQDLKNRLHPLWSQISSAYEQLAEIEANLEEETPDMLPQECLLEVS